MTEVKVASQAEIEAAFSAVKDSAPECANFIGVIIERCSPSDNGINWSVKGIKYGKAPRLQCDAAIETVTKKLQSEFMLGHNASLKRSVK